MLTYENFRGLFKGGKKYNFILYKGSGKTQQIGSHLPEGEADFDEAMAVIDQIITAYGDGVYTVECRSSKLASRGNDTHTFMSGDGGSDAKAKQAVAGAPAHPAASFFSGLDAKYFLDQANNQQSTILKLQMEILKKEMEIKLLEMKSKEEKRRLESEQGGGIAGFIKDNPVIVNRVLDVLQGKPAAIGTLTAHPSTVPAPPVDDNDNDEEDDDDEVEYAPGTLDLNDLYAAAVRVSKALPSMHPNEVFNKIAAFAEKSPQQAAQYLAFL